MNLNQYFGSAVYLTLTFAPSQKFHIHGESATTLATAVASPLLTGIEDLYLNLANETNPVAQAVSRAVKSIVIPFVYFTKLNNGNAVSTFNSTIRMSRAQGSKLKYIYYAPFNVTENQATAFDHSNIGGNIKINSFSSTLNSMRLQQFDPVCARNEDFTLMKKQLRSLTLISGP